ncbi:hypothetical protein COB52_04655, partial [Candidatus Kaiserbacteria bacterium]
MRKTFLKFIVTRPGLAFAATTLICAVLASAILFNYKTDFSPKVWFEKDYPELQTYEQFEVEFGNDDSIILAVHNSQGLLNSRSLSLIREITERFWKLNDVIRVDSVTNYQWAHSTDNEIVIEPLFSEMKNDVVLERRQVALSDAGIQGYLLNRTARTALIHGQLKPSFDQQL